MRLLLQTRGTERRGVFCISSLSDHGPKCAKLLPSARVVLLCFLQSRRILPSPDQMQPLVRGKENTPLGIKLMTDFDLQLLFCTKTHGAVMGASASHDLGSDLQLE